MNLRRRAQDYRGVVRPRRLQARLKLQGGQYEKRLLRAVQGFGVNVAPQGRSGYKPPLRGSEALNASA